MTDKNAIMIDSLVRRIDELQQDVEAAERVLRDVRDVRDARAEYLEIRSELSGPVWDDDDNPIEDAHRVLNMTWRMMVDNLNQYDATKAIDCKIKVDEVDRLAKIDQLIDQLRHAWEDDPTDPKTPVVPIDVALENFFEAVGTPMDLD